MDLLQPLQRSEYEGHFSSMDAEFRNGRMASAQKGRKICWKNWCFFVIPLGVEPWLQDAKYQQQVRCLTGFAACILLGRYGRGKKVEIGRVSEAFLAVGVTVALAYEGNPTKAQGKKTLVTQLAQIMEGRRKEYPPSKEKLPVGIDGPEFLAELRMEKDATEMVKVVGDCAVIAFYYLLRVGEYTLKNK